MSPTAEDRRVAVIGGGITGLAAAHRLAELAPGWRVALLEASGRLGGVLHTERRDGYLLERSADSFLSTSPAAVELCRRIGLADELIPTSSKWRRAFVVHQGRLEPVPEGFVLLAPRRLRPLLGSRFLSWRGKLRLLAEYLVPPRRDDADESLADFARRRLGREAYERLVQPLVGGIYTADAEKLSVRAALPRFAEMERRHGSLIRGLRREAAAGEGGTAGARYGLFVAPAEGLSSLVHALAARLPTTSICLNSPVTKILRADGRWRLETSQAATADEQTYHAIIVATAAPQAARLLSEVDAELSAELSQVPYAGCAVVLVGYAREQIGHPLNGFGFVVPEIEGRKILACSFSSVKFPGRAPQGKVLLRVFVGGARRPELVDLDDEALGQLVADELAALLEIRGQPELVEIARWKSAMPQYHVGHAERVERIDRRVAGLPGLELAGNAYHGVGIPDCVASAEQAVARLVSQE